MDASLIIRHDISDLEALLLNEDGELNVLPYSVLKEFPQDSLSMFCVTRGYYCIPTVELIDFLRTEIGSDSVIEVAAGAGVISRELGIMGTDSYMQNLPQIRALYEGMQQAIVPYGSHVRKFDAIDAVTRYKPTVVVAAWLTHKYNPSEHWRGGNQLGVDEKKLLSKVKKYIHVGSVTAHAKKPLFTEHHTEIQAPWLLSRTRDPDDNRIWIWER